VSARQDHAYRAIGALVVEVARLVLSVAEAEDRAPEAPLPPEPPKGTRPTLRELRKGILSEVAAAPGVRVWRLPQALRARGWVISNGDFVHALRRLELDGLVEVRLEGRRRCVYPPSRRSRPEAATHANGAPS
jgi:hypothetical protein